MRKVFIALLLILATEVGSETRKNASKFTVSVNLIDAARGGCWTNPQKVRSDAEEKLVKLGFSLGTFNFADTKENEYVLEIFVKSNRHTFGNNSFCDGGASVNFKTSTSINGLDHSATLAGFRSSGINPLWDNTILSLVDLVMRQIESYFVSTGK